MKNLFSAIGMSAAILFAPPVWAKDIPYLTCKNDSPIWTLRLLGDTAQFLFAEKTIDFEVADTQIAQPGPWPIALTLLARGDTAIVILRPNENGFGIDILTQNRQLPILLSGSCVTLG